MAGAARTVGLREHDDVHLRAMLNVNPAETPSLRTRSGLRSIPVGLFTFFVLTRMAASAFKPVLPDLEFNYIQTARAVFEHTGEHALYLPISYPTLLYAVNAIIGNWLVTTHLLYVVASTASAVLIYLLVRSMYGESIARRAVVLALVMPNYTAAVVGYSHTPVVGHAFLASMLYAFRRVVDGDDDVTWYVVATVSATAAILIRPETLLSFLMLVGVWLWTRRHAVSLRRTVAVVIGIGAFLVAALVGVERVALRADPTEPFGLLGNPRYSYNAYIHTLSMRANEGRIDSDAAIRLGERAFGPALSNDYSILRAVRRNPREAVANLAYNAKSLLKDSGHPLFMPVFLYPLVGIGLISRRHSGRGWLILATVVPATVASTLLTHVEVRYLMPLVLPLLVLIAVALEDLAAAGRSWVAVATYTLTAAVSLTYLLYLGGSVS
jgi:hypothetical protein